MRYRYLLFLTASLILFSCKKEGGTMAPPPPAPSVPAVLLKDIVISNLPSPYYHFEYNSAGNIIFASFAAGFRMYEVAYERGRISEMKNNSVGNNDRLRYVYDNAGRVNTVRYTDSAGIVYARIYFTYEG